MKQLLIGHDCIASVIVILFVYGAAGIISNLSPVLFVFALITSILLVCTSIITIFACLCYWLTLLGGKRNG
jgi:hypothetical protein